jgi:predicted dehydrogenase
MKDRVGGAYGRIRSRFGYDPKRYLDAGDMLEKEKDLDAVIVSTPDFWHSPHTVMSLQAGKHVYCEKMMAHNLKGARAMVKAMKDTGKLCQIGHQRRSNPRYIYTLKELIQRHKICGRIVNANAHWYRAVSSSRDITAPARILPNKETLLKYGFGHEGEDLSVEELHRRFLNWRLYKDLSGGPISDLGAHQIDIFNWFFGGPPKSVIASGGCDYFKDREHFDNVMCIFDYDTADGGARAFYQVLTTTSAGDPARDTATRIAARSTRAWGRFRQAAVSSFAFVEAMGPVYAAKLLTSAFGFGSGATAPEPAPDGNFQRLRRLRPGPRRTRRRPRHRVSPTAAARSSSASG